MKKNIIAIDLGSNSMSVLKMNCVTKERIYAVTKTVKTADGLAQSGTISTGALERVVRAIKEVQATIDFTDATVKAVTTEAIRQASNGEEVLKSITNETGITFEVINGNQEADYALLAVTKRLELLGVSPKSFVLADIGGGSTELIFHYGDKTIAKSFKIGIVTLTQSHNGLKEISDAIPTVMADLRSFCDEVYAQYGKVEQLIATAGTPTTIAAMKLGLTYTTYDSEKIHGMVLERQDLVNQLGALLMMPKKQREISVGVGRADLIVSGVLIFEEIYNITGFVCSMVIDDGVREGVAFAVCMKSFM